MDKFSFKELMEKYTVVVPMLQRDYAYGRADEIEKRENFLRNLKLYFEDDSPHELDFVYGSVDDSLNLKLLDGQQRITTLFLLHWYLALVKDNSGHHNFKGFSNMMMVNGDSKFLYKTRYSSTDFCNALVVLNFMGIDYVDKYVQLIENPETVISSIMKNEKWFLPHWNYDPTIMGMLNMIDAIKKFFKPEECREYYQKLVNKRQLTFNFLKLDDFKLTDELYIKMNSRGRALTRFENLKSKLLKLYDDAAINAKAKYDDKLAQINNASGTRKYKSLRDYVSFMLDTKWTDVFWNEWLDDKTREEKPNVDDMMLSFISNMAIYEHIIFKLSGSLSLQRKDELTKEINALMSSKDKNKGITIRYEILIDIFKENDYTLLFNIIDYFNIFNNDGKLKRYLPKTFTLFSEKKAFYYLANDYKYDMQYERKAKIFAFIKYISLNPKPNVDYLQNWMHFVCNVCSNSYTLNDRTETFCSAIAGLNYLYSENIVSELRSKDLSKIVTLDKSQIEEEILKMKLSSNSQWNVIITEAEEKLEYFEGRLRYPLIECCHVTERDVSDNTKCSSFKEYVDKIAAIFPDKDGCKCENELIRALLSKGNYLMYFNSNNTLLKNADRDNSWKRFLKEEPYGNNAFHPFGTITCDKRNYFKEVIDDSKFDGLDVKKSLRSIAESRADSLPKWRKLIIDCQEILDEEEIKAVGKDRYIRWNDDVTEYPHKKDSEENYEIDLIPGSAITGYHAELFSLAKYYELRSKEFKTLGKVKYQRAKTSIEQPYMYIGDDERPFAKVMYQDNDCFRFILADGTKKENIAYEDVEKELKNIIP